MSAQISASLAHFDPIGNWHYARLRSGIIVQVEKRPEELVGTLNQVTASWYRTRRGIRVPFPVHVWLSVANSDLVKLHTDGDGSVVILDDPIHGIVDMGEHGQVEVQADSPTPLAARVGQRIIRVTRLRQDPPGCEVGFLLHFDDGSVAVANLADDLEVADWSDERWSTLGITEVARA